MRVILSSSPFRLTWWHPVVYAAPQVVYAQPPVVYADPGYAQGYPQAPAVVYSQPAYAQPVAYAAPAVYYPAVSPSYGASFNFFYSHGRR